MRLFVSVANVMRVHYSGSAIASRKISRRIKKLVDNSRTVCIIADMEVQNLRKQEICHMEVDGEEYHRYSADHWTMTMSFDIYSEDYAVIPESAEKLEKLFQEYKELAEETITY
jgi:hypothetical protein